MLSNVPALPTHPIKPTSNYSHAWDPCWESTEKAAKAALCESTLGEKAENITWILGMLLSGAVLSSPASPGKVVGQKSRDAGS